MVYLFENFKEKLSTLESAFAGGASGAVTRAIAQPLDVVKIRFQLQLEPITIGSKYCSIGQAIRAIAREEGITALWSGHVPAQLLSISYGVLQFTTFEKLTHLCQITDPKFYNSHKHSINFCNGASAAAVATLISFPFDTVRTRLIAEQKTHKAYKGFVNAFYTMVTTEGTKSLFRGLIPTLSQIAPHAGIQFAIYKLFTENILNEIEFFQRYVISGSQNRSSLTANLLAGSVAGFVAKTAIYPFDVVKKRLQIQGFQQYRKGFGRQIFCKGSLHCIKLTVTEEGLFALYKGYGPSMIKAVLVTALHFAVYDEIKHFLLKQS